MNKIAYILEEYEKYLQREVDEYYSQCLNFNDCMVLEQGGTNYDDYNKIINNIETSLEYAVLVNDETNKGYTLPFILTDNTFLYKPGLKILFDDKSKYNAKVSTDISTYNDKYDALNNVLICYFEEESLFPKINLKKLKEKLWYELHHAYVVYCVKKEEYEISNKNLKKENERNLYTDFQEDTSLKNTLKQSYYYTNKDEINSHLNEMIPYLQEHEEINFINYKDYLNNIPGYDVINILKQAQTSLYSIKSSNEIMCQIGQEIMRIYQKQQFYKDKKLTSIQCFNFLCKRINNAILYSQKEFYKILLFTLNKLGRRHKTEEWHVKKKPLTVEEFDKQFKKLLIELNNDKF